MKKKTYNSDDVLFKFLEMFMIHGTYLTIIAILLKLLLSK